MLHTHFHPCRGDESENEQHMTDFVMLSNALEGAQIL